VTTCKILSVHVYDRDILAGFTSSACVKGGLGRFVHEDVGVVLWHEEFSAVVKTLPGCGLTLSFYVRFRTILRNSGRGTDDARTYHYVELLLY